MRGCQGKRSLAQLLVLPLYTLMAAALPALDSAACELLVTRGHRMSSLRPHNLGLIVLATPRATSVAAL